MKPWGRAINKTPGLIDETQHFVFTDGTMNKQGEGIIESQIKTHPIFNRRLEIKGNRKLQEIIHVIDW